MDKPGGRLALLGVLALLVMVGLHAHLPTPSWHLGSNGRDATVIAGLEVVVVSLLLVLRARGRQTSGGGPLAMRLRTGLRYLLVAGGLALLTPLAFLVAVKPASPRPVAGTRQGSSRPGLNPKAQHFAPPGTSHSDIYEVVLAILVAALVVVAVVLVARAARARPARPAPPEFEPPAEEFATTVREALSGGRRALAQMDDARAAIIACYRSVEDTLARAGTARQVAETPEELLGKAVSTYSLSTGAARQLTGAFYEARFSSHPLTAADKERAEAALSELMADLAPGAAAGVLVGP